MLTSSNIKAWSKCLFYEQQCLECTFTFSFSATLDSGYPVNARHAELERKSVHQLSLKAVDMLRSSTQLVKSHGDDLGLEYLWKGNEYSSLENSLKAMEKTAEYGAQPETLALVHVIERPVTVHNEDSDKGTVFGEVFTDHPSIDILYYPNERDDKGELIKAGHYMLLRGAALLSQPEMKRFILWVTMLLFAQKQLIGSCV